MLIPSEHVKLRFRDSIQMLKDQRDKLERIAEPSSTPLVHELTIRIDAFHSAISIIQDMEQR